MGLAIVTHFGKPGMTGKIMIRVVFKNKDTASAQDVMFKDQVGYLIQRFQIIRWPGEDVSIRLSRLFTKPERIHAPDFKVAQNAEFCSGLAHKSAACPESVDISDVRTSARYHLKTVAAGTAEEIEEANGIKTDPPLQDVVQCLF